MRIAFFGTPDFVTQFLDTLTEHSYTPGLIITGPDVPVGRKLTMTPPAPKEWAKEKGIPYLQPEKITDEFIESLGKENFDLFVVVAYGKILPEALITLPRLGTINVHYSLLPKYRGATPVESAILAGDTETGISIQQMVYELDAGAILTEKKVPIDREETHTELRNKLNQEALPLLVETVQSLEVGTARPVAQDESKKSICKKIKKEHGLIDLSEQGEILYRKYRAYFGWPGIFFFDTKQDRQIRIKIGTAHMEDEKFVIDTVIPEGKNQMKYSDYLNWK
jgi:methionyl-tRNA formyltransferase